MRKIIVLFNIGLVLLIIQSCSVTKRHYLPGYSVEWNNNKTDGKANVLLPNYSNGEATVNGKDNAYYNPAHIMKSFDEMPVSASIDAPGSYIPSKPTFKASVTKNNIPPASLEECDTLKLKNGEEIMAKVLEISQTEIKYKKCDNLTGPTYVLPKSDVLKIKYSTGAIEIINSTKTNLEETDYYSAVPKSNNNNSSGAPPLNKFALASMITAILSIVLFPLAPLPIIFGIMALKQMKKRPETYTDIGKAMAIFGIIVGVILVLLAILVLLFFLAFLAAI